MRNLLLVLFLGASAIFAADATIVGQGLVAEQRILWGSSASSSLYVTSTGYMIDVGGVRTVFDTTLASVGGAGACTQSIAIRTGSGTVPQAYGKLSLRMRTTDLAQAGIQVYLAFQDKTPVGRDSGWVTPSRNRVYDSLYVYATLTNPAITTSFQTWWMNGFVAGQNARVCVARTSSGPGAGDTVVLSNNWLEAR